MGKYILQEKNQVTKISKKLFNRMVLSYNHWKFSSKSEAPEYERQIDKWQRWHWILKQTDLKNVGINYVYKINLFSDEPTQILVHQNTLYLILTNRRETLKRKSPNSRLCQTPSTWYKYDKMCEQD